MAHAFVVQPALQNQRHSPQQSSLNLFNKIFEESGPLGKGITVGKVQVALFCKDRSRNSIFGVLERATQGSDSSSSADLARLTNEVCLQLLRRSDDWTAACSESQWYGQNDSGKAESYYNDLATREAAKFEKEYDQVSSHDGEDAASTMVVVSLIVEIEGDNTNFKGAGYSLAGTKEVLTSLASDAMVESGDCVNAAEVFWCPGEKDEVLSNADLIIDFPELIDL
ncbi:hypothetical protein MPSEU_000381600 [Mayamaea pseudoterrestris]|nr:hypothetical protein MPSEU_000381600 [Mayamaea pseudoterrestris]